jgi:hypothetical protein
VNRETKPKRIPEKKANCVGEELKCWHGILATQLMANAEKASLAEKSNFSKLSGIKRLIRFQSVNVSVGVSNVSTHVFFPD